MTIVFRIQNPRSENVSFSQFDLWLGNYFLKLPSLLKRAVAFSVPLNLHGSSLQISKPENILYSRRFLRNLKKKVKEKAEQLPDKLDITGMSRISSLIDFDDRYTAPIHGYKDALDYYQRCSSVKFIEDIQIPTLIVNAINDSL